jgi:arsenite methyltransferase
MSEPDDIKKFIREKYAEVAEGKTNCCSPAGTSCCGGVDRNIIDLSHGYDRNEVEALPEGSSLGLGCGNPLSLIEIQSGWCVLDLGSGAGVDVFLAAKKVGQTGSVVGLDMTDAMLERARHNAIVGDFKNVTFDKGEIEAMPFPDNSFDLVISNCVINLVPDKRQAYREIRRVLKSGGKFAISDMATRGEMPMGIRKSAEAWAGCVAGAVDLDGYLAILKETGFANVEIKYIKEYDFAKTDEYALLSVGLVGVKT